MSQFKKYLQIINEKKMPQSEMMPPRKLPKTAHSTFQYMYSFDGENFTRIEDEPTKSLLDQVFDPKNFLKDVFNTILNNNIIPHIGKISNKKEIRFGFGKKIEKTTYENEDLGITIPLEGDKELIIIKTTEI